MPLTPEEQQKGYLTLGREVVDPNANNSAGAVVRRYTAPSVDSAIPPAAVPPAPASTPSALLTQDQFTTQRTGSVDEAAIREQTRKNMQAMVDATNSYYEDLVRKEDQAGEERLAKVQAINVNSGLTGSNFATSQDLQQKDKNSASVRAIQNEKNLKLQEVYGKVDEIARAEITARKLEATGNADAYAKYLTEAKTAASDQLKQLAGAGVDLSQLDQNRKAYLFQTAGIDASIGDLYYNSLKPKAAQLDYKYIQQADGSTLAIAPDPNKPGQFIEHSIKGAGPDVALVIEMIKKYPDAGIAPTDDLASASEKIKLSRIFKKDTYIAPVGGANAGLDAILKTLQIKKAEQDLNPEQKQSAYQIETNQRIVDSVDALSSLVSKATVGVSGKTLGNIPSTPAYNFKAQLQTLKSNIAFGALTAMREASKTGGALGQVSDKESALLESTLGALDVGQSPEQFKQQLQKIRDSITNWNQTASGTIEAGSNANDANLDDDEAYQLYLKASGGGQ